MSIANAINNTLKSFFIIFVLEKKTMSPIKSSELLNNFVCGKKKLEIYDNSMRKNIP